MDFKMQTPVGGGCMKDWCSKTKTTAAYHRQRDPLCVSVLLIYISPILFALVTPALSIHMEAIESHSEFTCEPIRLRMCQDLPYNTTFMPNLLNHYDQQTAALAMEVGLFVVCVIQPVHVVCVSITAHGEIG